MMNFALRPLVLVLLTLALAGPAMPAGTQGDVASLKAEITKQRDEVEPEKIVELANFKTKEAADALVELYGTMSSIFMQREILRALVIMDGQAGAQEVALELLMDTATSAEAPELREAALVCLSDCKNNGKSYLAKIVEADADNAAREGAMELHVASPDAADADWYRALYEASAGDDKDKGKGRKDKDAEPERVVYSLPRVRELAFRVIASEFADKDLIARFEEEPSGHIRGAMLEELASRKSKKTAGMAWDVLQDINMPSYLRKSAAAVLVDLEGPKVAKSFIKIGKKTVTPIDVRHELARLLAEMKDESVDSTTNKMIAKGKSHEKVFALLATRYQVDEKTLKKVRKGLKDKSENVRDLTIVQLGERKDAEALEDLHKLIDKNSTEPLLSIVVEAISKIENGSETWVAELLVYASHEWTEVRNVAVTEIARLGMDEHQEFLEAALGNDNWSTRLATLRGMEASRKVQVLGPIIKQMQQEEGRMLHEFADTLWRLTGEPFRTRPKAWLAWFEENGATATLISDSVLSQRAKEEEDRRLMQISRAEFFGIRIRSKRVIFIIDISGSMLESLRSEYVGRQGEPRIDRAKKELKKAVEDLEDGALFNIITFSTGVESWLGEGVVGASSKSRKEAQEWIDLRGALGATNLYDAIQTAFGDKEADTIIILSDGEPTMGAIQDPGGIREAVARFNKNRGIEIHCIALGGSLQILEWLANDHGGRYTRHD
jgi:hypothetical protein